MAKNKDKKPNEIYPVVDISDTGIKKLPIEYKDSIVASFNCSGNRLMNLSNCPKEIKGDFICRDNQDFFQNPYPLNEFHLGAGRFDDNGGDEDEETNRKVKVGGSFITDTNTYKTRKIYDKFVGLETESQTNQTNQANEGEVDKEGYISIGTTKIVLNITMPILGFDLQGYKSWGNGKPTHGSFLQRLGYKGPHKKNPDSKSNIDYGGSAPPEGYKGWGDADKYFKNFINWSFFDSKTGRGGGAEASYQWGPSQINGVTVYDGKQYGNKTHSRGNYATYYYLKGDNNMIRKKGREIFQAKEGRTIEVDFDEKGKPIKADFFENIQVALSCASTIIENGVAKSPGTGYGGRHPFFGKLNDGTYFAGAGVDMYKMGPKLINFFKTRGKTVQWADCGDGGGSAQVYVNGVEIFNPHNRDGNFGKTNDNRPVAAVIAW